MIVTRFAPSPTGYLHVGGIRTALFNWLYARHNGGLFRLRIEDTDKARSTSEAVAGIFTSLRWLSITWDGEVVFQSTRAKRHIKAVQKLLECGMAYHCYSTLEELEVMRTEVRMSGRSGYNGRWRECNLGDAPLGIQPTIRLRASQNGETIIHDLVQGIVRISNKQLDDMILLRANGTPTYIFSSVVDDHDMGITHIIRGDDHLTNAFRQTQIYQALGWEVPKFAHVPLIYSQDGVKLSKRHGALGSESYRKIGYLAESLRNYLTRLGWGYKDAEIFTTAQATTWFDIINVSSNAARFDIAKLTHVNTHYLRVAENKRLIRLVIPHLETMLSMPMNNLQLLRLYTAVLQLKTRARTIVELAEMALFCVRGRPLPATRMLLQQLNANILIIITIHLAIIAKENWNNGKLENNTREFSQRKGLILRVIANYLRVTLTSSVISPPIFDVMRILGREEVLGRLSDTISIVL